jgi:hypothetical protein
MKAEVLAQRLPGVFYTGTFKATGGSMRAAFAHRWTLREGKIIRFFQYVDSAKLRRKAWLCRVAPSCAVGRPIDLRGK